MLKVYIKQAFRSILRNKVFSAINIIGLAVGLTAVFIISTYSIHSFSYNRTLDNYENKFRVTEKLGIGEFASPQIPEVNIDILENDIPEIKSVVKIYRKQNWNIKHQDKEIIVPEFSCANSEVFNYFDFKILAGDLNQFENDKNCLFLSKEFCDNVFDKNVLGETIEIHIHGKKLELVVSGIYEKPNAPLSFNADFIYPLNYLLEAADERMKADETASNDRMWIGEVFCEIYRKTEAKSVEKKLNNIFRAKFPEVHESSQSDLLLSPLANLHFDSGFVSRDWFVPKGSRQNVIIFSSIAILILCLSIFNFVLLNLGNDLQHQKDIGIKKVLGSTTTHFFIQNSISWLIQNFFALILSYCLIEIIFTEIIQLLDKNISSSYLNSITIISAFSSIFIFVGIFSSTVLTLTLKKINPIILLRKQILKVESKLNFRTVLSGIQLVVFIGLITSLIIINKQNDFFIESGKDYNPETILYISVFDSFENKLETVETELKKIAGINDVCFSSSIIPNSFEVYINYENVSNGIKGKMQHIISSDRFLEFMNIPLVQGNGFTKGLKEEKHPEIILNETAIKKFDIKEKPGEIIKLRVANYPEPIDYKLAGIVKDFHTQSLKQPIKPVLVKKATFNGYVFVKINNKNRANIIKDIRNMMLQFTSSKLRIRWLDENIRKMYEEEEKFEKIISILTMMAVFIASLGLIGQALIQGNKRVKEIGIRKVLGANSKELFQLLSKNTIILIIVCTIISIPLVLFFLNIWLSNFAFKISISPIDFISGGILAMFISLGIVIFISVKSVLKNPVESLRDE